MNRSQDLSSKGHAASHRLRLLCITFVLAAGMLAYEILLTRIASLLLTSDHLFLVIGLALLGLAIGAIGDYWMTVGNQRFGTWPPSLWLVANGFTMAVGLAVLITLGPVGGTTVLALAAAVPFAVAGLLFARIFRLYTQWAGSLYAADLVGAAVGALLVPSMISHFGPIQSILMFASVQSLVGAIIMVRSVRGLTRLFGTALAIVSIAFAAINDNYSVLGSVPVGKIPDKDLFRLASSNPGGVEFIESRWSTFGRTDLVRFPGRGRDLSIFVDGAAGTPMLAFDGNAHSEIDDTEHEERGFAGSLPLSLLRDDQKNHALIIGPGGGRDVLLTVQAGFEEVTAVEINPQMIALVEDYEDFNGGIYTQFDNVKIVNEEGRAFLEKSDRMYDLIMLFMPITKSSRSLNAFALSESYLFTTEAFMAYHDHLTDEGRLFIMAHGMEEAIKLTTTAVRALRDLEDFSVQEAMDHLYLLGSPMMPFFGLTKEDLDEESRIQLHALSHTPPFDPVLSYVPGVRQQSVEYTLSTTSSQPIPMMNPLFYDVAEGLMPIERLESGLGVNLAPASDDRPFFSQFGFGAPWLLTTLGWLSSGVLLITMVGSSISIRHHSRARRQRGDLVGVFVWVSAIGVGFIILELTLFQKLIFFLGDPSRSLSILLAALLGGAGIGSLASSYTGIRAAVIAGVATAGIAIVLALSIDPLFTLLRSASPALGLATAALLLMFQGFPMGYQFPHVLRHAGDVLGPAAVPWMWAINGTASVSGSTLAIIVAMMLGYTWSLWVGAGCYVVAALAVAKLVQSQNKVTA